MAAAKAQCASIVASSVASIDQSELDDDEIRAWYDDEYHSEDTFDNMSDKFA